MKSPSLFVFILLPHILKVHFSFKPTFSQNAASMSFFFLLEKSFWNWIKHRSILTEGVNESKTLLVRHQQLSFGWINVVCFTVSWLCNCVSVAKWLSLNLTKPQESWCFCTTDQTVNEQMHQCLLLHCRLNRDCSQGGFCFQKTTHSPR